MALFFRLKATPHAWSADEVAFLHAVADRTRAAIARVEAEDRQRLLNQELSHRMKNVLAMVQAIATQTMRAATIWTPPGGARRAARPPWASRTTSCSAVRSAVPRSTP